MLYSHTPATENLLTKDGNNRSRRPDYITEPHSHISGVILSIKMLTDQLRYSLCGTHHRARTNSFVGRNHHKNIDTTLTREVSQHMCRKDIILHRFTGVVFHHRHMLVSRSMYYHVGMILSKDRFNSLSIADVGHQGDLRELWKIVI